MPELDGRAATPDRFFSPPAAAAGRRPGFALALNCDTLPRRLDRSRPSGSPPLTRFSGHDLECFRGERTVFSGLGFALAAGGLAEAVAESLHAVTNLKGAVKLVGPGGLANDGRVIEDKRSLA